MPVDPSPVSASTTLSNRLVSSLVSFLVDKDNVLLILAQLQLQFIGQTVLLSVTLVGLGGTDEGQEVETLLHVVDSGLLEHCVIGGFGAGPLLRRRRGEEAFSLLAFVDGLVRSLESARSAEDIR
ncbi:hypothetical protein TYRP_010628 [Tyrophagus putrescentiae]|nr:hypothetical protein TYRP_010628 [Tyrophagus putrescentiae]